VWVNLYYKFIFINKLMRHNQVNDRCYEIKYLYLLWYLIFFNYVFIYCWLVFFNLFTQWLVFYLIKCVYKFFNLYFSIDLIFYTILSYLLSLHFFFQYNSNKINLFSWFEIKMRAITALKYFTKKIIDLQHITSTKN